MFAKVYSSSTKGNFTRLKFQKVLAGLNPMLMYRLVSSLQFLPFFKFIHLTQTFPAEKFQKLSKNKTF